MPAPRPLAWLLACLLSSAAVAQVRPLVFAGPGFPELAHVEAGVLINGRASIELQFGWVLFNTQLGLGVTGWFLGDATLHPPRHALLGAFNVRFNPRAPTRFLSGGELLAVTASTSVGYGFTAESGFSIRLLVGAIWTIETTLSGGPNITVGLGWVF